MNNLNRIRLLSALVIFAASNFLSPTRAGAASYTSFAPGQIIPIGGSTWGKYPDSASTLGDCELNIPQRIQVVKQTSEKNGGGWVYFNVLPGVAPRSRECAPGKQIRMRTITATYVLKTSAERVLFKRDVATLLAGKGTIKTRDKLKVGNVISVHHMVFAEVLTPVAHNRKAYREGDGCRVAPSEKIVVLGFLPRPGVFGRQTLLKYLGPTSVEDPGLCPTGTIYAEYLDFSRDGDYVR